MLAGNKTALRIKRQAVGAWLSSVGAHTGISARLQKDAESLAMLPAMNGIGWDVTKKK